jgi:hypothetical protein
MSKKLKINDRVVVQFLGAKYESQVIAIRPDSHYDLRKTDGTIIPNCAWQKDAHKKAPWWIVARIDGGVVTPISPEKPTKSEEINKSELDAKIKKQKQFIRGNIKK